MFNDIDFHTPAEGYRRIADEVRARRVATDAYNFFTIPVVFLTEAGNQAYWGCEEAWAKTHLIHEDFKGLKAYIDRHEKYSTWEARLRFQYFKTGKWGQDTLQARLTGSTQERRRFLKSLAVRMPLEPILWFLYHYVLRLGFLERRAGLLASRIRARYIAQTRAKVKELRRQARTRPL